jgi:LPXTG-motif cell wall-anchored protein
MGILNRRNAILGWLFWQTTKQVAKRKARKAVPAIDGETKRPNRAALILGALVAAGGALLFWRKRSTAAEPDTGEPLS